MKYLSRLILLFTVLIIFVSGTSTRTVLAVEEDKKAVTVDNGLHSEKYELDSYQSYVFEETNWFTGISRRIDAGMSKAFNFVANLLFSLNKMLFSVFDFLISFFAESSILNSEAGTYMSMSSRIYQGLFNKFGLTIIVLVSLWTFYLFLFKSPQQATKTAMTFLVVFSISFVINRNGEELLRGFNNISDEISNSIVDYADSSTEYSGESGVTSIRNTLFDISIKEPYYLMNYNELSSEKINTKEFPDRANALLVKTGEKMLTDEEVEEIIKESDTENIYLTGAKVDQKIIVAATSGLVTLGVGLPITAMQLFNFLLEIVILLLSSFLGIFLLLALIPAFQRLCWNIFQFILSIFGYKILIGFGMLLLLSLFTLTRTLIPSVNFITYLIQIILYITVLFFLFKFRKPIARMVGQVTAGGKFSGVFHGAINNRERNGNSSYENDGNEREREGERESDINRLVAALEKLVGINPNEDERKRQEMKSDEMNIDEEPIYSNVNEEQEKEDRGGFEKEEYTRSDHGSDENSQKTENEESDEVPQDEKEPEVAGGFSRDEESSESSTEENNEENEPINNQQQDEQYQDEPQEMNESEDNKQDFEDNHEPSYEMQPEELEIKVPEDSKEDQNEDPGYHELDDFEPSIDIENSLDPESFDLNDNQNQEQMVDPTIPINEIPETELPHWQMDIDQDLQYEQLMDQTYQQQQVENHEHQVEMNEYEKIEQVNEVENRFTSNQTYGYQELDDHAKEKQDKSTTDTFSMKLQELRGES